MLTEIEVLSGGIRDISVRRLNHGFLDALIITTTNYSRFCFQSDLESMDDDEKIATIKMRNLDGKLTGEESIFSPAFENIRTVKRIYFTDDESEYPIGFIILPEQRLPVILAPGNVFGSLSVFGLETRGQENGLEFAPANYLVR